MAVTFTRWTLLRIFELGLCISCLICKRVTDDEASRLFLLLQKLSREWSLLNNVTWDGLGAAVADATYGGYIIISAGLLLGNIFGELPTHRRITEMFLIGLGALLFIVLGALAFAALDSVPPELVDNAAILGTLSLVTAGLFLLDLGGPRAKKNGAHPQIRNVHQKHHDRQIHMSPKQSTYETEIERRHIDLRASTKSDRHSSDREQKLRGDKSHPHVHHHHSRQNGHAHPPKSIEIKEPQLNNNSSHNQSSHTPKSNHKSPQNGYHHMQEKSVHHHHHPQSQQSQRGRRFDIYGKDLEDDVFEEGGHTSAGEDGNADKHSPVWSKIRKGEYGKYDNLTPSFLLPRPEFEESSTRSNTRSPDDIPAGRKPASPGDPGYVQYTAKKWEQPGQLSQKNGRAGHSPTPV